MIIFITQINFIFTHNLLEPLLKPGSSTFILYNLFKCLTFFFSLFSISSMLDAYPNGLRAGFSFSFMR